MIHSSSESTQEHKFFIKHLDNDLDDLYNFLIYQEDAMNSGEILDKDAGSFQHWEYTGSLPTMRWNQYNVFQFYHPSIYNLYVAVSEMAREACNHYEIDFDEQQYMVQGWFNVNKSGTKTLDWHEHANEGAPLFHGYYSVNAEPSYTQYHVFNKRMTIDNKNNMALLSETGHPHSVSKWGGDDARITIAYDVTPLKRVMGQREQHWIPLR